MQESYICIYKDKTQFGPHVCKFWILTPNNKK